MKFPSPGAERIARALHESGPSTAASLAARLGLSGAVVRRHLDALIGDDLVSASDRPPYGPTPQRGRGRPARVFALTDKGSHAFDLAYDDLAVSALRFMAEWSADTSSHDDDDAVSAFARRQAESWSARHADRLQAAATPEEKVRILVEILNDEGYAATVVPGDGSAAIQVCQHHCPIAHVAAEFPHLCEAETQAFQKMLDTHVLRLATIAHGDGVCTSLVPAVSAPADPVSDHGNPAHDSTHRSHHQRENREVLT